MSRLSTWWAQERPRVVGVGAAAVSVAAAFGFDLGPVREQALLAFLGIVLGVGGGETVRAGVVPLGRARRPVAVPPGQVDPVAQRPRAPRLPRGLLASWPDSRDLRALDYVHPAAPQPKTLNLARGLTLDILGNDRIGDCFWAALLHGMQCAYTASGHTFTPTPADAVTGYRTTGYDPGAALDAQGNNPTDRGTEPRAGLKAAVKLGWIDKFVAVATDDAAVRSAVTAYRGAVILCWALPATVPENGDWTKPAGPEADGHATQPFGYTTTRISNDTWAERGWYTPPFARAYLVGAWAFTLPDPSVQPLVDHAALDTVVRAIRVSA